MEKRKPNMLLTIALAALVLAALICLIVFLSTRGAKKSSGSSSSSSGSMSSEPTDIEQNDTEAPNESEVPTDTQPPIEHEYDEAALKAALDDCLDGLDSTWQVVVIDLADGTKVESARHSKQTDLMTAADLTKLFLMASAYDQVNQGNLTEDQITDYVTKMIRDDNAGAANDLTKLIGGGDAVAGRAAVNAYAATIGCTHVEYNRLFGESGTQNYVNAEDCAELLRLIGTGACVSAEASEKMMAMLTGTEGSRIPGGVPEGTTVAHLNANITGTCCADVGIVQGKNRSYVLAIICNKPYSNEGSTKKCVEITKLVHSYLGE